jgi:hypothetical protein
MTDYPRQFHSAMFTEHLQEHLRNTREMATALEEAHQAAHALAA